MCHGGKGCCVWHKTSWILLIIGGLNWGLVGLGILLGNGGWNVVGMIFGKVPMLEAIIYLLVGVSAVANIFGCKCQKCMAACAPGKMDPGM